MAFIELNIHSETLRTQQQIYVIIPQSSTNGEIGIKNKGVNGKYKTLYLLHGLSDNHTTWLRRTSIERYAQEYGLCVVMPFGDRSFYTDMKHGGKYYTYISKELPKLMSEMFNVSDKREDRFIGGNSMGGYGALKIALKNPDVFGAAAGLSSVADIKDVLNRFNPDMLNIFGEELNVPDEDDLFYLVEKCNTNLQKPRIFMGIGTEDYLYDGNQRLRQKIEGLDFYYKYMESPGVHGWDFWDVYITHALKWLLNEN